MNKFLRAYIIWINKPADWYQVWRPQSGVIGGVILGLAIYFPLYDYVK